MAVSDNTETSLQQDGHTRFARSFNGFCVILHCDFPLLPLKIDPKRRKFLRLIQRRRRRRRQRRRRRRRRRRRSKMKILDRLRFTVAF